ncbi:MAG: rod shape-determining protein MreC, partial [Candidatus Brocadiia bacterium]
RDPAGAAEVFAVDVGTNNGVRDGMAVCSGRTIVGRIYRAGRTVSLVVGVRHPMFRVPVVVESGGDKGVAWGTGIGLEVRFVPIEAEISAGGAVVSSDDNADVPSRFLIGRVSDCKRDPVRLLWIIQVAPAPGTRNCEDLYIPLNWVGPAPVYVPKELR